MSISYNRSTAYAGVAFVGLIFLTVIAAGLWPFETVAAPVMLAFAAQHKMQIELEAWLSVPAGALFLWFAAGLNSAIGEDYPDARAWLRFAYAAAIVAVGLPMVTAAFQVALVIRLDRAQALMLNDLFWTSTFVGFGPFAWWQLGVTVAASKRKVFPRWLTGFGYVAFAAMALSTLGLFFVDGPYMPAFAALTSLSFVWILIVSLRVARSRPV